MEKYKEAQNACDAWWRIHHGMVDYRDAWHAAIAWERERRGKETCETFQEQALREATADLIAHDLASMSLLVLQRAHDDALEMARTIDIQFDKGGQPTALGRRIAEVEKEGK